jgi:hypothetical protein
MAHEKWFQHTIGVPPAIAGEHNADYRARIAAIDHETRERRRQEMSEQSAVQNTPEQRIQVWERVHQLDLPKKANHPLVRIIASDTELTLEQVCAEQRRRLAPVKPGPAIPVAANRPPRS